MRAPGLHGGGGEGGEGGGGGGIGGGEEGAKRTMVTTAAWATVREREARAGAAATTVVTKVGAFTWAMRAADRAITAGSARLTVTVARSPEAVAVTDSAGTLRVETMPASSADSSAAVHDDCSLRAACGC